MSEESKTPDNDYVRMGGAPGGSSLKVPTGLGLDDPNLSQEDKDMRLALALQQKENAAAYDLHMKKHKAAVSAQHNRTARSAVGDRLAAKRDKDHGMLSVPTAYSTENAYHSADGDYLPPATVAPPAGASAQEVADFKLAQGLQKVEQVTAGVASTTNQIMNEDKVDGEAEHLRTGLSNYHINQKGLPFKRNV